MHLRSFVYVALILFAAAGCSRQEGAASAQQAGVPSHASGTSAQPQAGQTATGTVVETMDAASYTYVRVKTATGEIWAATGQFKVAVGDRVVVPLEMPAKDFHSPSLNRDFPLLYFASHIDREGEAPAAAAGGQTPPPAPMMPAHGMTGAPATEPLTAKIPPPDGGISIADVWTRRAALAGKIVTVRGKVVKFNGGILDRNWIHIQDGTGDPKDGTNDLAITSQGATKVGDIITVSGRLTVNKDIGSGYKYAVIVEDATIR
jgi:hypothetical protein